MVLAIDMRGQFEPAGLPTSRSGYLLAALGADIIAIMSRDPTRDTWSGTPIGGLIGREAVLAEPSA